MAYKKSEEAQKRSATNKLINASKKVYHHTMGPGGYTYSMPKWDKLEADLLAKNITLEPMT